MSDQKYRQLAMFTTIVAEVVITPSILGGAVYLLLKGQSYQVAAAGVAALCGLGIAFYRINLLNKKWNPPRDE